jgi:hypothetical protein
MTLAEGYRGKNIGQKLFELFKKQAKKDKATVLIVAMSEANDRG